MLPPATLKRPARALVAGLASAALAITGGVAVSAQGGPTTNRGGGTESSIVTVPENADGWAEQASECHTGATLTPQQGSTTGPGRAPFGFSSHRFTINEYTSQTEIYRMSDYDGMPLQYLSRLAYSTYAVSNVDGPLRQPTYLRLTVDPGQLDKARSGARSIIPKRSASPLAPNGYVSLFFVPANNADQQAVTNGSWQSWDVANGHLSVDGDTGSANTITLAEFLNSYPDAELANDDGGQPTGGAISLMTGCGLGGNSDLQRNGTYNVDRLIVGADGDDTLYNLEANDSSETDGGTTDAVVDPEHDGQWYSWAFDWETGRPLHTTQELVAGAETPPEGVGSLRTTLSDDTNPDRVEQFATNRYNGTLLRDLRHLSYSTYETDENPFTDETQQPTYMFLKVDRDGDNIGPADDTLVFYPANNGEVTDYQWQNWHAADGLWNLNTDDDSNDTFSLESYLIQYPDARLSSDCMAKRATPAKYRPIWSCSGLGFQSGGGGDEQLNSLFYLDNINISTVVGEDHNVVEGLDFDLEPTIPVPAVSVSNARATEVNQNAAPPKCARAHQHAASARGCGGAWEVFHVTLDEPTLVPVTVPYATYDWTALAGPDYSQTDGTLTFQPGETSENVWVPLVADKKFERTERFALVLDEPSGATLDRNVGLGTIYDDDTAVTLTGTTVGVRQVEVSVSTRWDAPGAQVRIYRVTDGPNKLMLSATLNDNGRLAPTVIDRTFAPDAKVGLYAQVTTNAGAYNSQRVKLSPS